MTPSGGCLWAPEIIPYQELLGNYDAWAFLIYAAGIIPYQELLGNYDHATDYT